MSDMGISGVRPPQEGSGFPEGSGRVSVDSALGAISHLGAQGSSISLDGDRFGPPVLMGKGVSGMGMGESTAGGLGGRRIT